MIRQTGGTAVGEISTRSSPFCFAMISACGGGMMPSCCPVSSITRISRTRIRSLVRTRSSRRGERSKAISSSSGRLLFGGHRYLQCPRTYLVERVGDKGVHRPRAQIALGPAADRDGVLGGLAIPGDQHVRDLLKLGLPDLIANLLLALVQFHAEPGRREAIAHPAGVCKMPVGNRQHDHLHRRQPQREGARKVLDEQGDEALEAAINGAVNDDWTMFRVVGADVLQVEALGNLVVE